MSNEQNEVSGAVAPDAGVPTPTFSEKSPASSISTFSSEQIATLSTALKPIIEDAVNRSVQSTKDKRFSKLEEGTSILKDVLTTLKGKGVEIPQEMERDIETREYIQRAVAEAVPLQASGGTPNAGAGASGQFDALSVLKPLGLDSADPEVINLLKGQYRNPDHFQAEAARLAYTKAVKPAPSAAGAPPLGGGTGQHALTEAEKEPKYAKLTELYKTPTKSAKEIKSLEKELGME